MHLLARALVVTPSRGQVVQEPFFLFCFFQPSDLPPGTWPAPLACREPVASARGVRSHILMTMSSSFFSKSARYSLVAMFSRYTCA